MSPAEASLPSSRPVGVHLVTEYHHLNNSQAFQTHNIWNRIIFFHLSPQAPSPLFTISVNGIVPSAASQKPETHLRLLFTHSLASTPSPTTYFFHLMSFHVPSLSCHHWLPCYHTCCSRCLTVCSASQHPLLIPRSNIFPKNHLLSRVPPIVPRAYRSIEHE